MKLPLLRSVPGLLKNKNFLKLILIYTVGIIAFAILLVLDARVPGTDDTSFIHQIKPFHSVFSWVDYRYFTWSGRIFSEAFIYIFSSHSLIYWKIVSLIMYGVFVGVLFGYWKLFRPASLNSHDLTAMILALILPYFMDPDVSYNGLLWETGGIFYGWITTFGMLGLYAPLSYLVKQRRPPLYISIISLIGTVIAASSQEQVGAVLVGLLFVFFLYRMFIFYKEPSRRNFPFFITIYFIISLLSYLLSIKAPGDVVRLQLETKTWLPTFYSTPLLEHINYSARWVFESFFIHSGYLLIGSWVLLLILFSKKLHRDRYDVIAIFLILLSIFFIVSRGFNTSIFWYNYFAYWHQVQLANWTANFIYLPSLLSIIATVIAPILLYRKQIKGYFISLLYLASLASITLVTLSPTLYASGNRSLFIPSVLLLVVVYILSLDIFNRFNRHRRMIIILLCIAAVSQYLILFLRLLHLY